MSPREGERWAGKASQPNWTMRREGDRIPMVVEHGIPSPAPERSGRPLYAAASDMPVIPIDSLGSDDHDAVDSLLKMRRIDPASSSFRP